MLEAIAARLGVVLSPAATPPSETQGHVFAWVSSPPVKLLAEAGIHRAQIVPRNSQIGRIFTSTVGVEFLVPGTVPTSGNPDVPVLKTYNYVQRRVTRHATQERLDLDAVLSGSV